MNFHLSLFMSNSDKKGIVHSTPLAHSRSNGDIRSVNDIRAVNTFLKNNYTYYFDEQVLDWYLVNEFSIPLAIYAGTNMLGFIHGIIHQVNIDNKQYRALAVDLLCIDKRHRKMGLSKKLINEIALRGHVNGCEIAFFTTTKPLKNIKCMTSYDVYLKPKSVYRKYTKKDINISLDGYWYKNSFVKIFGDDSNVCVFVPIKINDEVCYKLAYFSCIDVLKRKYHPQEATITYKKLDDKCICIGKVYYYIYNYNFDDLSVPIFI